MFLHGVWPLAFSLDDNDFHTREAITVHHENRHKSKIY